MTEFAVITPSFRPDVELFTDLHRSVLQHTGLRIIHHVLVPDVDRTVFAQFEGPRCRVWTASELLPRRYLRLPWSRVRVNARRPWSPIRGWVLQQVLKIAAAHAIDAEAALMADSDVVLVRDVSAGTFVVDGRIALFRVPGGVDGTMPNHIRWHQMARQLLGLPPQLQPPLPDYISALNVWSLVIVRQMSRRIQEVSGRHWVDALTAHSQISEFILYGVFVDEIMTAPGSRWPGNTAICHSYWDTRPLDMDAALVFAGRLGQEAIGMMISARSNTPHDVRQAAIQRCAEIVRDGRAP